jgi:hypothetical protein
MQKKVDENDFPDLCGKVNRIKGIKGGGIEPECVWDNRHIHSEHNLLYTSYS